MNPIARKNGRAKGGARRIAALGLAASGLSLAADRAAEASIVYSGPQNIPVDSLNPSYNLDLDGDSNVDFTIDWQSTIFLGDGSTQTSADGSGNGIVQLGGGYAAALAAGDLIDGAASFATGAQVLGTSTVEEKSLVGVTGAFPNAASDTYLGLKFDISGQDHYGWALIDDVVWNNGFQSLTIQGWAYETTARTGIRAGAVESPAVPEPASLVQLALGAAALTGLGAARRRRSTTLEAL